MMMVCWAWYKYVMSLLVFSASFSAAALNASLGVVAVFVFRFKQLFLCQQRRLASIVYL